MFNFFKKRKQKKILEEARIARITELEDQLKKVSNLNEELNLKLQQGSFLSNTRLLEQNNKLIDWIEKILKEVNTCQVNDRRTFIIPIYKDNGSIYYKDRVSNNIYEEHEEVTIIPEIIIKKVRIGD